MSRGEGGRMKAEQGRRFKPYPAYKDSGVEWLGEIPAHWDGKRLKHLLRAEKGAIKTGPFRKPTPKRGDARRRNKGL